MRVALLLGMTHFRFNLTRPIGYFTNGATSEEAIILEALSLLAARYDWRGRSQDAFEAFHGKRPIGETLARWESHNAYVLDRVMAKEVAARGAL